MNTRACHGILRCSLLYQPTSQNKVEIDLNDGGGPLELQASLLSSSGKPGPTGPGGSYEAVARWFPCRVLVSTLVRGPPLLSPTLPTENQWQVSCASKRPMVRAGGLRCTMR